MKCSHHPHAPAASRSMPPVFQVFISAASFGLLPSSTVFENRLTSPSASIGAPDPTAYAEGGHSWYLDEGQVCALVRTYLGQNSGCEQIQLLFAKVREMLKRNDENGPRLLQLLSEQFLTYKNPWATTPLRPVPPVLSERMQNMWDQLGALWVCVVLNPYGKTNSKERWIELLKKWISLPTCPPETCASGQLDAVLYGRVDDKPKRTVFTRALEAAQIEWTDDQLKWIANDEQSIPPPVPPTDDQTPTVNDQGQLMWDEHVPMACARVDSLRAHGYKKQALALAVSVSRTIKHAQATATPSDQSSQQDGWICHPLDPINCLFDTLWSAGNKQKKSSSNDGASTSKEKLNHRPGDSVDQTESFSALALEVALIALSQRRKRPNCSYAKQKTVKQEQKLIAKIKALTLDDNLMTVVTRQAHLLLTANWSGLTGLLTQPAPVHTVACHLFESLLEKSAELAYQVGLTAMRAPVVDGQDRDDGAFIISHPIAWNAISFNHCEHQQSELARSMLLASKDDVNRLRQVLETVHGYMRSSLLVYRLAHEIHQAATSHSEASISRRNLINAALELGLQVLRMTVGSPTWWPRREMVRWLVNCASSLNLAALLSVLTNWSQLFTPAEACGTVAQLILADTVTLQLKLDGTEQQQLMRSIHAVAVQCSPP
uniref:Uncharacterized protein n=1 Tax=Plectus sambesii TaxID=2011161 RepID=A0A914WWL1_9BILA